MTEAEEMLTPVAQQCAELGLVRLLADAGPQLINAVARIRGLPPSFLQAVATAGNNGLHRPDEYESSRGVAP